jgi:hypothetical protein
MRINKLMSCERPVSNVHIFFLLCIILDRFLPQAVRRAPPSEPMVLILIVGGSFLFASFAHQCVSSKTRCDTGLEFDSETC